jgi:hypothetical protein
MKRQLGHYWLRTQLTDLQIAKKFGFPRRNFVVGMGRRLYGKRGSKAVRALREREDALTAELVETVKESLPLEADVSVPAIDISTVGALSEPQSEVINEPASTISQPKPSPEHPTEPVEESSKVSAPEVLEEEPVEALQKLNVDMSEFDRLWNRSTKLIHEIADILGITESDMIAIARRENWFPRPSFESRVEREQVDTSGDPWIPSSKQTPVHLLEKLPRTYMCRVVHIHTREERNCGEPTFQNSPYCPPHTVFMREREAALRHDPLQLDRSKK